PIDTARMIAQELIRTGHYQHAELGINAASVTDGRSDGARVQNVQQGSAAAEAGIQENDVITKVGNRAVGSADALTVAIHERATAHEAFPGSSSHSRWCFRSSVGGWCRQTQRAIRVPMAHRTSWVSATRQGFKVVMETSARESSGSR